LGKSDHGGIEAESNATTRVNRIAWRVKTNTHETLQLMKHQLIEMIPNSPPREVMRGNSRLGMAVARTALFGLVAAIAAGQADDSAFDDQGAQVFTRGPVHEAFSGIVSFNPEPGVMVEQATPEAIKELPPESLSAGDNISWVPAHHVWTLRGHVFVDGYWDHSIDRRGVLHAPVWLEARDPRQSPEAAGPATASGKTERETELTQVKLPKPTIVGKEPAKLAPKQAPPRRQQAPDAAEPDSAKPDPRQAAPGPDKERPSNRREAEPQTDKQQAEPPRGAENPPPRDSRPELQVKARDTERGVQPQPPQPSNPPPEKPAHDTRPRPPEGLRIQAF